MRKYIIAIIMLITVTQMISAQSDRDFIRQGNRLYNSQKFAEAEVAYRKAIAQNPRNSRAFYNLGCALQKEGRDSDAIKQYEQGVKIEANVNVRAQGYYNMGVAYQTKKDYGNAIEAYKSCLRLTPDDNDARYNYVLCKRQQQQQQNSASKNNKNEDKNKNKQKQDKDKQNKDNQENKQNKDQQKQPDNQQNGEMSRENAEQLLQAAMNEEQQTEAKLKKAMQQPSRRPLDKNW